MGKVLEVDRSEGCEVGKYIRVRVEMDLHNPLKRGSSIQMASNKSGKIYFKYERLPDLCFVCGRLGHL